MLLIVVSVLAVSALGTTEIGQRVAGYQKQEQIAFYAAEAGVAEAREIVRGMGGRDEVPDYPGDFPDDTSPVTMSKLSEHEGIGQPKYFADPDIAVPIGYIGEGSPCTEGCNMAIGGTKYNHTRWQINIVGESPSGDSQRIQSVATRMLAVGY